MVRKDLDRMMTLTSLKSSVPQDGEVMAHTRQPKHDHFVPLIASLRFCTFWLNLAHSKYRHCYIGVQCKQRLSLKIFCRVRFIFQSAEQLGLMCWLFTAYRNRLLYINRKNYLLYVMQSIEHPDILFQLTRPKSRFIENYRFSKTRKGGENILKAKQAARVVVQRQATLIPSWSSKPSDREEL